MLVRLLLDLYTAINMGKNREELKELLLYKAKQLLKKDKKELDFLIDKERSLNIENEKIILEIEKEIRRKREEENRDFKEFY
ncbi:hypothetical protein N5T77_10185 [Aliarcobacter cryaerophilus]|uniref:hypothetical protein n=1 Tax=Aliarcobacter cryaerophilus TaxID=28198 RepID=UPI0021B4F80C|nr:hypothetical protein [Aliarcobacter cryaerophilus]MCT7525417.1 hypothetical protein [Aliarcobacter cryaerophilus]